MNTESNWDMLLRIHTAGRDDTQADPYRYPYEPTPYAVLERLADSGYIHEGDVVLDYGCGKGRVGFFLSHRRKVKTIGVEYDGRIYGQALENRQTALSGADTEFILSRAETCAVPESVNRCYFFNPFSAELLHRVLARIMESCYEHPRQILLFFYYPSDEYMSCLMAMDELTFCGEIPCGDLFGTKDTRERIVVFSLGDQGVGRENIAR